MPEVLQAAVPFNQSMLWELQKKAYLGFGPKAWTSGVPSYITSNPFAARLYAGLTLAFLEDADQQKQLDFSKPVYLFDLGAGSGRFAYLFLRAFEEALAESSLSHLKYRYFMTDICPENIASLKKHPLLNSYFEKAVAEGIVFHHNSSVLPKLNGFNPEEWQNPCVLIANYFFDTVPQALYKVENEELYEGYVELALPYPPEKEDVVKWIADLECNYSFKRIEQFDKFLYMFGKRSREHPFLFPEGAVQTLNTFKEAFKGRCFLIAGDQGQNVQKGYLPQIAKHGAFSVGVNYEALSAYLQEHGGIPLEQRFPNPVFVNFAASLTNTIAFNKTANYFRRHFDSFSPADQYLLVDELYSKVNELSFASLNAMLKLSDYDPINLYLLLPSFTKIASSLTELEKMQLLLSLDKVIERYYAVSSEEGHFLNDVGVLYYQLKAFKTAVLRFDQALALLPNESSFLKNRELAITLVSGM